MTHTFVFRGKQIYATSCTAVFDGENRSTATYFSNLPAPFPKEVLAKNDWAFPGDEEDIECMLEVDELTTDREVWETIVWEFW